MAKKRTSRQRRLADDAALQAVVRFGPEESGLATLAQQLRANYKTSVNQARATSGGIIAAVNEARPEMAKVYDDAGLEQARAASVIGPDMARLGPVANAVQLAASTEAAQGGRHIAEGRAAALGGLAERKVQAAQGAQFATQNARKTFVSDMAKLLERRQGLGREKGAFTAATINALLEKEADRALTRRGQDVGAATTRRGQDVTTRGQDLSHADRVAGRRAAAAKDRKSKTPTGEKINPAGEHRSIRDEISKGVSSLRTLDPDRDVSNWGSLGNLLQSGAKSKRIVDPKTGKPKVSGGGTELTTPEVPSIGSLSARVALDMYYHGGISRETRQRIWDAGYSVEKLGLKGKAARRRSPLASMRNPFTARVSAG